MKRTTFCSSAQPARGGVHQLKMFWAMVFKFMHSWKFHSSHATLNSTYGYSKYSLTVVVRMNDKLTVRKWASKKPYIINKIQTLDVTVRSKTTLHKKQKMVHLLITGVASKCPFTVGYIHWRWLDSNRRRYRIRADAHTPRL